MSMTLAYAPLFESATKTVYVVARIFDYAATAAFVGGLVFVAVLWPEGGTVRAARRLLIGAWVAGINATVAGLGLEGAWIASAPPSSFWRGSVLRKVLGTDFGREWSAKVLLWLLAGVVLADLLQRGDRAARSLAWRVSALAVVIGIVRVIGLTGHSRDTVHPVLAQVADLIHLAAMSTWAGGLMMMLVGLLPTRVPAQLTRVVPRYSLVAMTCVLLVISSGLLMAWQLIGTPSELLNTTYGHLLLTKVVLLSAVMLAALASKNWVEHRLVFASVLRGDRETVRPFVVSVATETVLVLLVLSAASFLVTASPGR